MSIVVDIFFVGPRKVMQNCNNIDYMTLPKDLVSSLVSSVFNLLMDGR